MNEHTLLGKTHVKWYVYERGITLIQRYVYRGRADREPKEEIGVFNNHSYPEIEIRSSRG